LFINNAKMNTRVMKLQNEQRNSDNIHSQRSLSPLHSSSFKFRSKHFIQNQDYTTLGLKQPTLAVCPRKGVPWTYINSHIQFNKL